MSEKAPKPQLTLSPEQQDRKDRYLKNLENIQDSDPETFYLEGMKKGRWSEVTDENELQEFRKGLGGLIHEVNPHLYGLYREDEAAQTYFAPRFNKNPQVRQILLDMMVQTKKIAPWAKFKGLMRTDTSQPMFEEGREIWTFKGKMIQHDINILEAIVNGLGDPKHSIEEKQEFIRGDVAALVHENVHIANSQGLSFGGPARILWEVGPMTAEYLSYPGQNRKFTQIIEQTKALLKGQEKSHDDYNNATLLGMLVMAKEKGLLPNTENMDEIESGLEVWQAQIEDFSGEELAVYRQEVASSWMLSDEDVKLEDKIAELKEVYPDLVNRLLPD